MSTVQDESVASSLPAPLRDAANILLLASPMDTGVDEACLDLLMVDAPSQEDVLYITFTGTMNDRLSAWRNRVDGEPPAKVGLICVGEMTRSAASHSNVSRSSAGPVSITTISDPGDLTGIGITLNEYLSQWDGDGNRLVGCFDSLTSLLQYTDIDAAFRFLHVVTGRFTAAGAVGHYHLDPSAHDDQTVNSLIGLFDAVVELEDGEWSFRSIRT